MIITVSGRRVKRPLKNFVPARGSRRGIWTRQAKALAPWAGAAYSLTDTGAGAMEAADIFERRQSAYRALGMHWLADVREIRRRYTLHFLAASPRSQHQGVISFTSGNWDDQVNVIVTGNSDDPFCCNWTGREVHLPNVSFELAAQMWMAAREAKGDAA